MSTKAIGMVETLGLIPAIRGLDASLKSADITLQSFQYVSGGLVTFIVEGDVGAVKEAVDIGVAEAKLVGEVVGVKVIPRPSIDLSSVIQPISKTEVREEKVLKTKVSRSMRYTKEQLYTMKTVELRRLARKTPFVNLSKKTIRDGRKDMLVEAILTAYRKESNE